MLSKVAHEPNRSAYNSPLRLIDENVTIFSWHRLILEYLNMNTHAVSFHSIIKRRETVKEKSKRMNYAIDFTYTTNVECSTKSKSKPVEMNSIVKTIHILLPMKRNPIHKQKKKMKQNIVPKKREREQKTHCSVFLVAQPSQCGGRQRKAMQRKDVKQK